jgi:Peptidase family M28
MNNRNAGFIFILALVALVIYSEGNPPVDQAAENVAATHFITAAGVRGHMEVLADDALNGREAGTDDYDVAADYVAAQYQAIGLSPLGDDGGYFQAIPFLESRLDVDSPAFALSKDGEIVTLALREDYVTGGSFGDELVTVAAPVVFAGYCIDAPIYNHNDFDGIDAGGKILACLSGAPASFETDQRAYYSSSRGKADRVAAAGGVGIISIRTPVDMDRRPWARYLPGLGTASMRWLDSEGNPYQGYNSLIASATLSLEGAQKLFALSGRDLDAIFEENANSQGQSFDTGVVATFSKRSNHRNISSSNVLGVLIGRDPRLKDEYIIYTAHLDHIGVRPSDSDDEIHNGAWDNSAGVASIIEIARAMAQMEHGPRRSVIFAAVTAEEKGLRGSSYLARNLPVPLDQVVANINVDMPVLSFPVSDITPIGAEHSTLMAAVEEAASLLGMTVTPDPLPEQVRFVRSDQLSFVLAGVPALAFKAGTTSSDPAIDGDAALQDFLDNRYHQPGDDLSQVFNEVGAERFVRAGLMLGLIVADADQRPVWVEGDFFGDLFGR